MPRLLSNLAGAATIYAGIEAGREAERLKKRRRLTEARQDETYELDRRSKLREDERADIEHGDYKRGAEDEAGAREAARRAAEEAPAAEAAQVAPAARTLELRPGEEAGGATTLPAQPDDTGTAGATPLTAAGGAGDAAPARTLSMAQPQQPVNAAPAGAPGSASAFRHEAGNKALWARTAEAQRDYWNKRGKPDKAVEVMTKSYKNAIAERSAVHEFETIPEIEKLRATGRSIQELEADQKYKDLRLKAAKGDTEAAGLMWGLVLSGNKKAAVDEFNASKITLPGMQIVDIGQNADGTKVFLLDKDGQVAKDKQGRPLVYPRQLLDNLHAQAQSSTVTLNKGQTVVQVKKGPGGAMEARPLVTAPDPEAERKETREKRIADATAATTKAREDRENQAQANRDRALIEQRVRQSREAVRGQLFAGQTMLDKVDQQKQKIHGIAASLAEEFVRGGMDPGAAAQKAIKDAEDRMKRERAGAGPRSATADVPAASGPTWQDMLR